MTRATHAGFLSRAELDLRPPRSISRNIVPQEGGNTVHYAGPKQHVSPLLQGHTRCLNLWRMYQRVHMDDRGFVDIAYNGGYCQHGYVFAGRGLGVRSAANGTNSGNYRFYAWCWIGGEGETPTREALNALAWLIRDARRQGAAGMRVVPHSWHKPTGCPGDGLRDVVADLDNQPIDGDTPMAHKHFDQIFVGANSVDIENCRQEAVLYGWAQCLIKPDGSLEVVGPHPDQGRRATGGFAIAVGSAVKSKHLGQFADGVIKVSGGDRNDTAAKLGQMLLDYPPHTIDKPGRPW